MKKLIVGMMFAVLSMFSMSVYAASEAVVSIGGTALSLDRVNDTAKSGVAFGVSGAYDVFKGSRFTPQFVASADQANYQADQSSGYDDYNSRFRTWNVGVGEAWNYASNSSAYVNVGYGQYLIDMNASNGSGVHLQTTNNMVSGKAGIHHAFMDERLVVNGEYSYGRLLTRNNNGFTNISVNTVSIGVTAFVTSHVGLGVSAASRAAFTDGTLRENSISAQIVIR